MLDLELGLSYKVLQSDLVMLAETALSNICRRDYSLTVDVFMIQLLSQNNVCLTLDRWTSRNKLPITLVIGYYMDWNWALRGVQPAFDEVDRLFLSFSES